MAKRGKRGRKWQNGYQRRFEDSDFAWMAEQFQKQAALNPDLTLKEFAIRHGVQPDLISRFIDKEEIASTVRVWHGTTEDRAKSIMEEGFKAKGKSKKIYFTRRSSETHAYAQRRSRQCGEPPVIFCCGIDLGKYTDFERPRPNHYVFGHSYIAKDIIRSLSGMEGRKVGRDKQLRKAKDKPESVDVAINKSSGKLGVLYWMNRYLELENKEPINEDHPAVEAVFKWIEMQYTADGEEAISDEEMLIQVTIHLEN